MKGIEFTSIQVSAQPNFIPGALAALWGRLAAPSLVLALTLDKPPGGRERSQSGFPEVYVCVCASTPEKNTLTGVLVCCGWHQLGPGWVGRMGPWHPQKRVSRKEVEPRWALGGPSMGGPRARIRSPWKVLPRVWGLRRLGLGVGSSGGCTTMRGTSGRELPCAPASCWASKMARAPGRRGLGDSPGVASASWASWTRVSRCRSRSDRATPCTWEGATADELEGGRKW